MSSRPTMEQIAAFINQVGIRPLLEDAVLGVAVKLKHPIHDVSLQTFWEGVASHAEAFLARRDAEDRRGGAGGGDGTPSGVPIESLESRNDFEANTGGGGEEKIRGTGGGTRDAGAVIIHNALVCNVECSVGWITHCALACLLCHQPASYISNVHPPSKRRRRRRNKSV